MTQYVFDLDIKETNQQELSFANCHFLLNLIHPCKFLGSWIISLKNGMESLLHLKLVLILCVSVQMPVFAQDNNLRQ